MEKDDLYYYDKAVKRLKGISKTDPTSVIATLEKEIDSYRTRIQRLESQKKFTKIQKAMGEIDFNSATIVNEDKLFLYVSNQYGISCYAKLELAKFWLTHDNDYFYKTFGFSWVPSDKLQEEARKETSNNSNITIGIDFGNGESQHIEPLIPKGMLKDIAVNLDSLDGIKHSSNFSNFHN
ncbi:MAG: hypothetical protein OSJ70_04855 [Bacilli bacterium]|nr:hypothetical protein [Bacilli bacterium]